MFSRDDMMGTVADTLFHTDPKWGTPYGTYMSYSNSSLVSAEIALPLDVSSGSRVAELLNNKTPIA